MHQGPKQVSASLGEAARRLGIGGAVELAALERAWPSVVGPQVAGHCTPVSVRKDCLTVRADHPALATQLRLLEAEVLEKASSIAPGLKRIFVQVSPRGSHGW